MSLNNTLVSLNLRFASEEEDSNWFTALAIPPDLFPLYAVKPRKWLSYLGYAVTGSVGVLTLTQDKSIPCDLDDLVNAGDIYYFHATNATHFADPDVISKVTSEHSSQSGCSTTIRNELIVQYGACPFSRAAEDLCDACHLIPHVKGDAYIKRLTEERSAGLTVIEEISDIRNMLFLWVHLHRLLDKRMIAFLQTPNVILKTDDIVRGADPEAYLVTLHCFEQRGPDFLVVASHGKSAAFLNEDTRPPEVIYSMIYGSAALNVWAPPLELRNIKRHTWDTFYPEGTRSRGSDRAGEESEKAKREKVEKQTRERHERHQKRNRKEGRDEGIPEDKDLDDIDTLDILMAFRYVTQRGSENLRKAAEDERKKASVEKVHDWLMGH